ncbi:MAG: YibE/F family protein [Desulfobacterium sp.]|nr:YibE/F family protein [Desulfobacterium sp.]
MTSPFRDKRNPLLIGFFILLTAVLLLVPTGFQERVARDAVRCKGTVLQVDNSEVRQFGMIRKGGQGVTLSITSGPFKGEVMEGVNQLMGQMDRDKLFSLGDTALVVLSLDAQGKVVYVNPQAHYRLGMEILLLVLFSLSILVFGGWTGARSLLSFILSITVLWKVLVPLLLRGMDPIPLALGVTAFLTCAVIFLVAGPTVKGVVAFAGAFLGIFTSCILSIHFAGQFHLHGAIMPFSETLLYSGFGHLDLGRIYIAGVFIAASGAVMDLAMDVSASMHEVVMNKPDITRAEAFWSGLRVARTVVGTMTTTLLFAYSGGYITLLMAFMAQGVPLDSMFNLIYVAAEVLKTLVGSFGLVTVGPFTAFVGSLLFVRPVPAVKKASSLKRIGRV